MVVAFHMEPNAAQYRAAMRLIVQDDAIQGGAATFRGTRILVRQIADLIAQGVDAAELFQDYPRLTPEMIDAARIFAARHPEQGGPRGPAWREPGEADQPRE